VCDILLNPEKSATRYLGLLTSSVLLESLSS